ncbi:MAG: hypothetical protein CSA95_00235 [Bacteroidetes bacterium]|nr:MAG: hypothetical protein CSA95_00235 [Bacteroidota bacterium]
MKKLQLLFFALFCAVLSFGQLPQGMNLQMIVRNHAGALIPEKQVGLRFTLVKDSIGGTPIYQETQQQTTNLFGLVNVVLGQGTEVFGDFASIQWQNHNLYLKQELDLQEGDGYLDMGTTPLLSVSYAMVAGGLKLQSPNGTEFHWEVSDEGEPIIKPHTPPEASFMSTPLEGEPPLTVTFTDQSSHYPSTWQWDFGDGATSTEQHPVHEYTAVGDYTVTLTAGNPYGTDTETKEAHIHVALEVSFVATPLVGEPPLTVTFTDQSSSAPTSWQWDFGDGTTSTEQHPVHEYTAVGDYTVTLTVGNVYGTGTETKEAYIHVENYGEPCPGMPTMTDIDGNSYKTVLIDDQCWMKENLNVTHYPNGDAIPHITDDAAWGVLGNNNSDDAYCYYENNSSSEYGALYTYAAAIGDDWERDNAEGQGICPDGWHLPTDEEWSVLENYLGESAGGKMKEVGMAHWRAPNWGATNESGFTALPGGYRYYRGSFRNATSYGRWWSATEPGSTNAWYRHLDYGNANVSRYNNRKSYGFSVRCVQDN